MSQVGHGRTELAEVAAKQAGELAFFPIWSYAHPQAIELAARLAEFAPGDLNRIFFTTGGVEAVESAWKVAKQFFKLTGKPTKHKVISRAVAYHGTPQGALSITGVPAMKQEKLRGLALATNERMPQMPEIPTAREAGFPQLENSGWLAVFAPAGTPSPSWRA